MARGLMVGALVQDYEDPRFGTVEGRRKNRGLLEETIENIFRGKDHKHWLARLKQAE